MTMVEPAKPLVWIVNPDAEAEAATRGDYTPPRALMRTFASRRKQFDALVQDDTLRWAHELKAGEGLGRPAVLWCATDSAKRAAKRAGFLVGASPPMAVMKRVLNRAFLAESPLPGPRVRCFVRTEQQLDAELARLGPGVALRTKRAFGCAGRGHRVLRERLVKDDLTFLLDGLRAGGLVFESELNVENEFSVHGVIDPHGKTALGAVCRCSLDAYHQPLVVARVEGKSPLLQRVRDLGAEAARCLHSTGYFGPFGLDVLHVGTGDSTVPGGLSASDLNARFTLGWSTGMGPLRSRALQWLAAPGS